MAAISIKCRLEGSRSSHHEAALNRQRKKHAAGYGQYFKRAKFPAVKKQVPNEMFTIMYAIVHVFTNAGKAIILENLKFSKTKFENELNLRILFKCLFVNMNFSSWPEKSFLEFAKLLRWRSRYLLDAAHTKFIFFSSYSVSSVRLPLED